MDILDLILVKLAPLYFLILLGFISGKYLQVDKGHVATLVIYIIIPVVFAGSLWQTELDLTNSTIILVIFLLCLTISIVSYAISSLFYKDNTRNLLASGLPTGNTGYFGIPIALALFDLQTFGLYVLAAVTNTLYQVSVSYYILAAGAFDWREAFKKLFSLPPLYGALIGVALSVTDVPVPQVVTEVTDNFKAALSVLGMMIIGLAMAGMTRCRFDLTFFSLAMAIRFVIWPVIGISLVFLDQNVFGLLDPSLHKIILLFSVLPIAADFVIYASNMNLHPQKAALAVLLSTLIAAISIPLAYVFLLS